MISPTNVRRLWMIAAAAVCLLLLMECARAQTVVDGDTIKLNGTTWRLHGIDAPEMHQSCGGWPAGGRYSLDYIPQENQAKAEGLGIHRYACMPAWEWRKDHR